MRVKATGTICRAWAVSRPAEPMYNVSTCPLLSILKQHDQFLTGTNDEHPGRAAFAIRIGHIWRSRSECYC